MVNDNFTTTKYHDYNITIQKLPNNKTVINLTNHPLKLDDLIIEEQLDDELLEFINTIINHVDVGNNLLDGFPIVCNNLPTRDWMDFFYGGLLELSDYVVVNLDLLYISTCMSIYNSNLYKVISPIGELDHDDVMFLVYKFQTWNRAEEDKNYE